MDKDVRNRLSTQELRFVMTHTAKRAKWSARAPVRKPSLFFLALSVFICVHPWFQITVHAVPPDAQVLAGIDVLEAQRFAPLAGKRVGLITNQTGVDRGRRSTIDLLAHAPGVKLVYGDDVRPTDAMLAGLDALVFDIQDAGVRFYTYITTMGYTMEAAAKHHLAYYVLDRPNPLGGERIEGPMLDRERTDFTGYFPMPVRMAMTLGEMAQMFNAENKIGCDLHVILIQNWRRRDLFDATGLPWVDPSPNLRSLSAEILYPGLEILQAGGVSVGRGTDRPFERIGAPWMRGAEFSEYMKRRSVPGVRFVPDRFTPDSGLFKGEMCEGASVMVTNRDSFASMRMGIEIAAALAKLYPRNFDATKIIALVGNAETIRRLKAGDAPAAIVVGWNEELETFRKTRAKYLLYP